MTIDWWTLGFQAVNVAILIWLLGYFFWKPVAGMIDARRASAQKLTDDAEATRAKAEAELAEVEKTRAGFARERDAILADAHKDAEAASAASLAKTKIDADSLEAGAKAVIAKDQKAQEGAWAERSAELAIDIAGRLATRLDSAVVQACFLEWLLGEIRELPELALKAAGAKDMKLEVASAVKLDAAERKSCAKVIAEAFGGDPHITFRTDRTLIAGFELHGEHLIVRSSWRADLAAIQADLAA
jgi:F-type H+-transporting ATPase subunit b